VTLLLTVLMAGAAVAAFAFHIGIRPVLSGSMKPTYGPGWAIITRPLPVNKVHPGDIVVFTPPGADALYAHRVVTVSGPAQHPLITTKGDANPEPDAWHLQIEAKTVPQVVAEVPFVGTLMVAAGRKWVHVAILLMTGLAFCAGGVRVLLADDAEGARRTAAGARARRARGYVPAHTAHADGAHG